MIDDVNKMMELLLFAPYTYESSNTSAWTDQMRRQLAEYLVKHIVKVDELAENDGDLAALRAAVKNQIK